MLRTAGPVAPQRGGVAPSPFLPAFAEQQQLQSALSAALHAGSPAMFPRMTEPAPPLLFRRWTPEEDQVLLEHVRQYGTKQWSKLQQSGKLPDRDNKACCNRYRILKKQQERSPGEGASGQVPSSPVSQDGGAQRSSQVPSEHLKPGGLAHHTSAPAAMMTPPTGLSSPALSLNLSSVPLPAMAQSGYAAPLLDPAGHGGLDAARQEAALQSSAYALQLAFPSGGVPLGAAQAMRNMPASPEAVTAWQQQMMHMWQAQVLSGGIPGVSPAEAGMQVVPGWGGAQLASGLSASPAFLQRQGPGPQAMLSARQGGLKGGKMPGQAWAGPEASLLTGGRGVVLQHPLGQDAALAEMRLGQAEVPAELASAGLNAELSLSSATAQVQSDDPTAERNQDHLRSQLAALHAADQGSEPAGAVEGEGEHAALGGAGRAEAQLSKKRKWETLTDNSFGDILSGSFGRCGSMAEWFAPLGKDDLAQPSHSWPSRQTLGLDFGGMPDPLHMGLSPSNLSPNDLSGKPPGM